ncbi:MAG: GAF domain-containing protein [Deltaproteobacteria bacterium]|nr:GAF domain-containing protein [Deltaproteobacteria bacterium]MBW2360053.1 GAF domain-containing protein [Deltaproteobacteria bacterium]
MNVLHLLTLAVLLAATVASLVVMARSGETRVALLAALFLLLGIPHGIGLSTQWNDPLGLDLSTAAAAAGLAAALLGLASVLMLRRTLLDLDQAEGLHWNSMESVRSLSELAARRGTALDDRLPQLLQDGCERLGLEIGLVSQVRGERYEVIAIQAPPDFPVGAGAIFPLDETYCAPTLASDRPVAVSRAADASWAEHPARTAFRFETYLAAAIRKGDEAVGTLVFASREPRSDRLAATHKDLVQLMAQWVGWELERGELEEASSATHRRRRLRVRHHGPLAAPGLRVDTLLRRVERRVRRIVPAGIEVEFTPVPELPPAREPRLPLEAILLSLVRRAAAVMPASGTLRISAAAQDPPKTEKGVLPAVVPARYVTLSVSESSGGLDSDALARAFDDEPAAGTDMTPEINGGIPLATVYRMLQRAGGDLSVEVEPGHGSRFTIFLPIDGEDDETTTQAVTAPPSA